MPGEIPEKGLLGKMPGKIPGKRGQGALEYLLILATILAIAVVVILVAHHVLSPAKTSSSVAQDKYSCSLAGIELIGYNSPYDGTQNTAPRQIKPCGTCSPLDYSSSTSQAFTPIGCIKSTSCKLGDYDLTTCFKDGKWSAYLENSNQGYFVYGSAGGGGGAGEVIYASGWSASKKQREGNCGNTSVFNRADIDLSNSLILNFDCSGSGGNYILYFYKPKKPFTSIINIYYKQKSSTNWEGPIQCEISNSEGSDSCNGIPCNGKMEYKINASKYVYLCAGDTRGDYCDWANSPEECTENKCKKYDYCHPPYLKPVQ